MRLKPSPLGDYLRTFQALQPDDAAAGAIAGMLGLAQSSFVAEPVKALGPWQASLPTKLADVPRSAPASDVIDKAEQPNDTRPRLDSSASFPCTLRLVRQGGGRPQPPAWLAAPGEMLSPELAYKVAPAGDALFAKPTRRAILVAAVATKVPEGDPDWNRILSRLSARQPFLALPRQPASTLRRGVQVLLDIGRGMDPYALDRDALVAALSEFLPSTRINVLWFSGCPGRGCATELHEEWHPWQPPPPGTPVLAATDLGIGGPLADAERASTREWVAFAAAVKAVGCPLLALVPYAADRWPRRLARAMCLLHWSERASARQIAHARRRRE